MIVAIHWRVLLRGDPGWEFSRCLYARIGPGERFLAIGRVWNETVASCAGRSAQPPPRTQGLDGGQRTLLGSIALGPGVQRLTAALLAELAALLICVEQPVDGMPAAAEGSAGLDLDVECTGDWPGRRRYLATGR